MKKCRRSRLCNCRGGLVLIQMQFRVCSFDCVRVSLKSDWIRKQVVSRHESSTTLYMFLCKKGGFIERISRENLNNVCNRALATIMIRVFLRWNFAVWVETFLLRSVINFSNDNYRWYNRCRQVTLAESRRHSLSRLEVHFFVCSASCSVAQR